jgi:predicted anti-sigma-YlaC factor YlaD
VRFEAHLDECDACREYLDQMRATIAVVGSVRPADLPDETRAALLEAFRGWRDA